MLHEKRIRWLSKLTAALFLCAGVRDMFAPGFMSISPRMPDTGESAAYIIIGLLFFSAPAALSAKKKGAATRE